MSADRRQCRSTRLGLRCTSRWHQEVGRNARQLGIDKLITVGSEATPAAEAFGRDALCFDDQAALQSDFPALPAEYTIWVKGSRGAGLEHTVAWLLASGGATAC